MKKIFSFLCLIVAVTAMTSCSSAKEEKGTSGTGRENRLYASCRNGCSYG